MQLLPNLRPTHFFAIGSPNKTSLIAQYCRQHNFVHLKDPIKESTLQLEQKHHIIQGNMELFQFLEVNYPDLQVIMCGSATNEDQSRICRQYRSIGKCTLIRNLNYNNFRKQMNPNFIFFYGPVRQQVDAAARSLASVIGYTCVELAKNANVFINSFNRTINYVVKGLFTDKNELAVLQEYFNFKVIHLQFDRIDLPDQAQFFDKQFQILPYLKSKPYYVCVKGSNTPVQVMDDVGTGLCPELYYVNRVNREHDNYISAYVKQVDSVYISLIQVQGINRRKNLPVVDMPIYKSKLLTKIIYKDLNLKEAFLTDFPWNIEDVIEFEQVNRKFKCMIDLVPPEIYDFSGHYLSPMYFLDNQKRLTPNVNYPLKDQLKQKLLYWIVNGPACAGKSTVAKYLSNEFGYKLLEYEKYVGENKEKIMAGQQGQQIPFPKLLAHFKNLLQTDKDCIYVIDGLPFQNKDLQNWLNVLGCPNIINLKVQQAELIKRARKKNEGDLAAQVTEEQTTKVKQAVAKNNTWLTQIKELSPLSKVFELNYDAPEIISEELINSIIKKRVYLVQMHPGILYQNIAIEYCMDFVNLIKFKLKDSLNLIKKSNNRDVILCYYKQEDERLISEDMHWIEKNIGSVRYIGVWHNENKQIKQEMLFLQKPVKPEPPKKAEGEQGEEKAEEPKDQGQQGQKKKQLDIYAYEWTKPTCHKNLSQWFCKLKKNITERTYCNGGKQCFYKFTQVLKILNEDNNANIYQKFS